MLYELHKDYNSNTEVVVSSQEIRDISIIIKGEESDAVNKYLTECIVHRLEYIEELMEKDNYKNCAESDNSIVHGTMRIINAIRAYVESHNSTDAINAYYKEHSTYKGLDEYLKTIE